MVQLGKEIVFLNNHLEMSPFPCQYSIYSMLLPTRFCSLFVCLSFSPDGRGAIRFPEAKRSHQADPLPPKPPVPSHLPLRDEAAKIPPLPGFYGLPSSKFSENPLWYLSRSSSNLFYLVSRHACRRHPHPAVLAFVGGDSSLWQDAFWLTLASNSPVICYSQFLRLLVCFGQNAAHNVWLRWSSLLTASPPSCIKVQQDLFHFFSCPMWVHPVRFLSGYT